MTSEFFRKTQLESDVIAAQQIQRALQPGKIEQVFGYQLESYFAEANRQLVADEFTAAAGEDRGLIKHARYYWLLLAESQLTRGLFERWCVGLPPYRWRQGRGC